MNPYRILQITPDATQQEIIRAVTLALQRKDHTTRQIADAQKELMNPRTRRVAAFIYLLDSQRWAQEVKLPEKHLSIDDLELLHSFDRF
ncbi:MAG: hypothetical protein AB1611_17565 [bacterium]